MNKYLFIDLYTGESNYISLKEFKECTDGMVKAQGEAEVYKGEEYIVIVIKKA